MSKMSLNICLGALVSLGFGLMIGKRKCDQLEAERDVLELQNKCLESNQEFMQIECDNLKETNDLLTNLLMREKEKKENKEF